MSQIDFNRLQELLDARDIHRVLVRYCRGMDRMDRELTLSCWHPGGTDDHAPLFKGTAEEFVEWLWPVHAKMTSTRHEIFNIQAEIEGDAAGTECYYRVFLEVPEGDDVFYLVGSGRYVDNFERINGVWAIRHRQALFDWTRVLQTSPELDSKVFITPNNPESKPKRGLRSKKDYSYSILDRFTK